MFPPNGQFYRKQTNIISFLVSESHLSSATIGYPNETLIGTPNFYRTEHSIFGLVNTDA